jgi:hypothetical protein
VGNQPRAVASDRRTERTEKLAAAAREQQQRRRRVTGIEARGERPPSPFGGLPVSEIAILVGGVSVVVGFINGGGAALVVGFIVCALGVIEVTAREHFSGYRSHTVLLAAIPAVGVEFGLGAIIGGGPKHRGPLLAVSIPVFVVLFLLLRRRWQVAHQARLARPPRA